MSFDQVQPKSPEPLALVATGLRFPLARFTSLAPAWLSSLSS